jgi:hypothetical protein
VSTRSGQEFHEFWGSFATRADLPNVAGALVQKAAVEIGDYAWVTDELGAFRCLDATLGAAVWVAEPWNDQRRGNLLREDWISLTAAGNNGWSTANIVGGGAGASSQINNATADASHVGILESDTGTGATGQSTVYLGTDGIVTPAVGGLIVAETAVRFPVLSTVAEEYISRFLFGDSLVAADHTDGIYFEYDRTTVVVGDTWSTVTAAAGVRTRKKSAVAIVANTWYRLRVIVSIVGGFAQALFYVDDVLVATHTNSAAENVPTGAQRYAPNLRIQKLAPGVAVRTHLVDYFQMRLVTAATR